MLGRVPAYGQCASSSARSTARVGDARLAGSITLAADRVGAILVVRATTRSWPFERSGAADKHQSTTAMGSVVDSCSQSFRTNVTLSDNL